LLVLASALVAAGVTAGVVAVALAGSGEPAQALAVPAGVRLPGDLTGPAPWPRNVGALRARLEALGLPALAREGTTLHLHQHVDLYVEGRPVVVPAGIGIDDAGRFISPLHTHDATGIVHVESPTERTFTLGQFFDVWGVRFTRRCLGGYCATAGKRLRVYVTGKLVRGDPRRIALEEREEIVVAFGSRAELPRPLPRSYAFPPGL
jgi:hypothetical protein